MTDRRRTTGRTDGRTNDDDDGSDTTGRVGRNIFDIRPISNAPVCRPRLLNTRSKIQAHSRMNGSSYRSQQGSRPKTSFWVVRNICFDSKLMDFENIPSQKNNIFDYDHIYIYIYSRVYLFLFKCLSILLLMLKFRFLLFLSFPC